MRGFRPWHQLPQALRLRGADSPYYLLVAWSSFLLVICCGSDIPIGTAVSLIAMPLARRGLPG